MHEAEKNTTGSVVFINKGDRHIFDLTHRVRIVDSVDYAIADYNEFYGLVCGILSQNYDISHIFVDSITKIVNNDLGAMVECLDKLNAVSEKQNAEIMVIVSLKESEAPEGLKKYL